MSSYCPPPPSSEPPSFFNEEDAAFYKRVKDTIAYKKEEVDAVKTQKKKKKILATGPNYLNKQVSYLVYNAIVKSKFKLLQFFFLSALPPNYFIF